MKKHSKALSKKIMLSLMVAGVMSSYAAGVAGATSISESYTAPGPVDLEQIIVTNGTVELMHGGTVTHVMTSGELDDRTVLITGAQGSLTSTDVIFTGDVRAMSGASITLNGGSVIAGPYYEKDDDGNPYLDGGTELGSFDAGSVLRANDVDIRSAVNAQDGGQVIINDSNITTDEGIWAEYGGSVTVNSGTINVAQIYADSNSTISLLGEGVIKATEIDEFSGNYEALRADNKSTITGQNLVITGSVYASGASTVTLTGGSITGIEGENNLGEIEGRGGTVTLNKVEINTSINSVQDDSRNAGKVIVNNSNINATEGLWAGNGGTIELNSTEKNTYKVADYLLAEGSGKIYINGGTLDANNLKSLMYGIEDDDGSSFDSADNGIVLAKDGKISTMTDQIFDVAASGAATAEDTVKVTNTKIDYQGGTLIFNDAEYTNAYLSNAKDALLTYQPGSGTLISMTGTLIDNTGTVIEEMTLGDLLKDYDGVLNEQVVITPDADNSKNLLVGVEATDTVENIEIQDSVDKGFGAAVLHLGKDSDGMVITNNSEVTLGGGQIAGDVIKVLQEDGSAKASEELKVIVGTTKLVGDSDATEATLNIGGGSADQNTNNQLTGSVTVNAGSTLNTTGQTTITGGVTLNGAELNVLAGQLKTDITASGAATITGTVHAETLAADEENGAVINIGNDSKAGNVTVDEIALSGSTVFLDPVWTENGTISDASGLAVVSISDLDGNYIVGRNSLLSLGAERADAEEVFQETGLTWGKDGISAAAYVDSHIDVSGGSLIVDGSLETPTTGATAVSVSFADNSLLMVNGANIYGEKATAAITGVTSATVDDGAKLQIANAKEDGTYKILAGVSDGWDKDNIGFTNQLMGVERIDNEGDYFNVIGESLSVRNKYGDAVVIADIIDDARANYPDSAAAKFFNSAVDNTVNDTDAQQIDALNNAAAMSELAGVSHATYSASNILTNAVADHMSLARSVDHDTDIWAHYVHTKENIDGLAAAGSGAKYDAQYNGIVVGADLYKQGKGVVGAALTYIDGKVTGSTKNEAEYYGLSIYGGVQNEDSAVIGDISYLHGKNEITQNNSGYTLTGEPKSDAFSVGVRAEQSFKAGAGKVVPYAGLRYLHLGTGNYTNSIGLSYDADDANLFLLPIGVKYSAEHKTAGWTLRPIVEVGYVWAMGDRDGQQTVSLNGTSNGFGYDVTDSGSYIGRFVLEAEKANVTYGLGYEYQKGDSVKANKWMVNLNWNF